MNGDFFIKNVLDVVILKVYRLVNLIFYVFLMFVKL